MAGIVLEKGTKIYHSGQPMTALHLIMEGYVTVSYPGGSYRIGKGDVIGICEICSEIHFLEYTAQTDATILTYAFTGAAVLDDLLKGRHDVARLFLLSAFHQINILLEKSSVSGLSCSGFYQSLQEDFDKYFLLCKRHRITPRTASDREMPGAYLGEEAPDLWLTGYYLGLGHILSGENYKSLVQESALTSGFLRKCSLDFRKAYSSLEEQFRYLEQVAGYYFNASGSDLFDCYTSLYYKLGAEPDCADADELFADINRMILQLKDHAGIDEKAFSRRVDSFRQRLALLNRPESSADNTRDDSNALTELAGSLDAILEFAEWEQEFADAFRRHVDSYKLLPDKFSTDEESCRLRAELTKEFYLLYELVFRRTLEVSSLPAPVRMFLYFGYVDEELAGIPNALYLYHLTEDMDGLYREGVYTFYDWLLAIFQGKKEPSRNEFDQDYSDYLHKQKVLGNLTDAELQNLESDTMAKVSYELHNMFPTVNKMTYGRVSVFCPLFTSDNILKNLNDSLITASSMSRALDQIRKVDYTLFYREKMDMDYMDILGKETFHYEYLPDIILMPNVGIRGVMWQEIEGRYRSSSGRMLFSAFHLEDLKVTVTRLAGEFRWELCKRIQGSHWNDVSDRSLTSEYFDYIQFYRKNHELSSEAKEKVRSGLQRAKNSFKEMFIRDYIIWVMFEGNGAPRLNRVARKILFTYCPFPKEICEDLRQNPIYTELLNHYDLQKAQKLHHLDTLVRKLRNGGTPVPDSLEKERLYVQGIISS